MKLGFKAIEKDGAGTVSLTPMESEDLWHVYNLIAIGDHVTTSTIRFVYYHIFVYRLRSDFIFLHTLIFNVFLHIFVYFIFTFPFIIIAFTFISF